MAHDRTGDETIPLTHEFLSLMLGVRRAGVTEALQSLKRQKLIDTGRNQIVVRNRKGHRAEGRKFLRRSRKGISAAYWIGRSVVGRSEVASFVRYRADAAKFSRYYLAII